MSGVGLSTSPKLALIVVGPTAVGKTDVCIHLANVFGTEIVSADARQFYREMAIGTAKPSLQEQQGIRHHLVDCLSVTDAYTATAFEQDALVALSGIFLRHDVAIVTGGSGLYVQVLCEGLDAIPDVAPEIRQQLSTRLQTDGLAALLGQLDVLDPAYGKTVDRANPQRIIRALEVSLSTGKPYSSFRQRQKAVRPFHIRKIGLERDRAELYARIDQRVDDMLLRGLVDEAKRLLPYRDYNALQTVGYTEVFGYLDGAYDYAEMVRLLKRNTRRYAKRQLTWFRRDPDIRWFHPTDSDQIIAFVQAALLRKDSI